jgi:hypothetical protein
MVCRQKATGKHDVADNMLGRVATCPAEMQNKRATEH